MIGEDPTGGISQLKNHLQETEANSVASNENNGGSAAAAAESKAVAIDEAAAAAAAAQQTAVTGECVRKEGLSDRIGDFELNTKAPIWSLWH